MGAAKWTVATYFPFLLLTGTSSSSRRNAAAICAFDIEYTSRLGWPAYERMLRFSDYLKSELAGRNLKPRDNIDVQRDRAASMAQTRERQPITSPGSCRSLPARDNEVEEFIDLLNHLDSQRALTRMAMAASEPVLSAVWDNPDDAEYDAL